MDYVKKKLANLGSKSIRNRIYAIKEFLRSQTNPILVYQMAKVGSTSVYESLNQSGLSPLHVHFITSRNIKSGFKFYESSTEPPPIELYLGQILRPYLHLTTHNIKVVTLVRDQIARFVSGVFQLANMTDAVHPNITQTNKNIIDKLSDKNSMDYTFNWFDEEIKEVFSIDIIESGFNKEMGYSTYRAPRADIMVLKLEFLSELMPNVLSEFVGKNLNIIQKNVGAEKELGDIYEQVKATINIPEDVCNRIYSSNWVKHFYTQDEIKNFKKKWMNGHS